MDFRVVLPIFVSIIMLSGTITPGFAQTVNPVSAFPIIVDGAFSPFDEEWSDITPEAFISPDTNSGTLFQTTIDPFDPAANAFTYAALAPTVATGPVDEIYLMYDYLPRTDPFFIGFNAITPGEFVADIFFPITITTLNGASYLPGIPESMQAFAGVDPTEVVDITVQIRVPEFGEPLCPDETGFFDVFIVANFLNPALTNCAVDFGIEAAGGFGLSPQGNLRGVATHLLVELEVPLLIDPTFPEPGSPIDGGVPGFACPDGTCGYSPDPAFWGASVANDLVDPPASAAVFTINPDGSTTVQNVATAPPTMVSGSLIPIDFTMVLLAGTQMTAAWIIPVIVAGIGFAIVIARKF